MKQSGIPTVVKESSGRAAAIALPEVNSVSVSNLVGNYLAEETENAAILLDLTGRKFRAQKNSESKTEHNGVFSAIQSVSDNSKYTIYNIMPDSGQSGRSLTFGGAVDVGAMQPAFMVSFLERLEPVKPRFTVESLVSALASEIPSDFTGKVIVEVDQENARISVGVVAADAVPSAIATAFGSGTGPTSKIVVTLADPTVDSATPLPFEGGEIPA